jgi:cytochrome c oxidase subunit 2
MVSSVRIRDGLALRRPTLVAGVLVGASLVLAGCGGTYGAPDPVTEQGKSTLTVWRVFLFGAVAVAALIWVLVLWSVIRYRRRPGPTGNPPQRQYNIPMELGYTILPILAVIGLFGLSMWATSNVDRTSPDPDLTVDVEGFQWQWQFRYPDAGVTVTGTEQARPTLVLPVGRTIRFDLHADDVIHSFWVPEFLEKRDLIPGVDNSIDVEVTEPGEWIGRCAEYCGFNHWLMAFDVKAVPADEFDAWLADASGRAQPMVAGSETAAPAPGGGS